MYARKYGKRYGRRKMVRRARRRVYRKKTTGIRRVVKSMINRRIETKTYTATPTGNYVNFPGQAAAGSTSSWNLMPMLSQGTADYQRIGNRVDIKRAIVKGWIVFNNAQSPLNSVMVRILIVSSKAQNASFSGGVLSTGEIGALLRSAAGYTAPNGALINDQFLPVNQDVFTIHHERQFILGNNVTPATGTTGTYANCGGYPPYKKFRFDITKGMKHLRFDDAAGTQLPVNHNMFMVVMYNTLNGALNDGITNFLTIGVQNTYMYKDA